MMREIQIGEIHHRGPCGQYFPIVSGIAGIPTSKQGQGLQDVRSGCPGTSVPVACRDARGSVQSSRPGFSPARYSGLLGSFFQDQLHQPGTTQAEGSQRVKLPSTWRWLG